MGLYGIGMLGTAVGFLPPFGAQANVHARKMSFLQGCCWVEGDAKGSCDDSATSYGPVRLTAVAFLCCIPKHLSSLQMTISVDGLVSLFAARANPRPPVKCRACAVLSLTIPMLMATAEERALWGASASSSLHSISIVSIALHVTGSKRSPASCEGPLICSPPDARGPVQVPLALIKGRVHSVLWPPCRMRILSRSNVLGERHV